MKEEINNESGGTGAFPRYKIEDETKVLIKPHLLHAWQRVAHYTPVDLPP